MWQYQKASFSGNKDNPQQGDYVVVTIVDEIDGEIIDTTTFSFTFNGDWSKQWFINNVKSEIKAHIADRNLSYTVADVTAIFKPD